MGNIYDYIRWRGDLTFDKSAFNDIDALILSMVSYLDFNHMSETTTVQNVYLGYLISYYKQINDAHKGIVKTADNILKYIGISERYQDVEMSDYVSKVSEKDGYRFAAICFTINGKTFVSFRGTDDTLEGYREDFYMIFNPSMSIHEEAYNYLNSVMDKFPNNKIIVGGHSKGGNMAIYAATRLDSEKKKRILNVYNFEGPGISEEIINSDEYKEIEPRIRKFITKCSAVGVLLHDDEKYRVVATRGNTGFMQHNGIRWMVDGINFVYEDKLNSSTQFIDSDAKVWLGTQSKADKLKIFEKVYKVIKTVSGVEYIHDITRTRLEACIEFVRNSKDIEPDEKNAIISLMSLLIRK